MEPIAPSASRPMGVPVDSPELLSSSSAAIPHAFAWPSSQRCASHAELVIPQQRHTHPSSRRCGVKRLPSVETTCSSATKDAQTAQETHPQSKFIARLLGSRREEEVPQRCGGEGQRGSSFFSPFLQLGPANGSALRPTAAVVVNGSVVRMVTLSMGLLWWCIQWRWIGWFEAMERMKRTFAQSFGIYVTRNLSDLFRTCPTSIHPQDFLRLWLMLPCELTA